MRVSFLRRPAGRDRANGRDPFRGPADGAGHRLRTEGLGVRFAGVKALAGVDLVLERGEVLGLIGPNGAGKTTMLNAVSGAIRPTAGEVYVDDTAVTNWSPHRLAKAGLARTFQNLRLFRGLSVRENIEAAAVAGPSLSRRNARRLAVDLLEDAHLTEKADWRSESLSYGEEQRLAIARALAVCPSFLLLDEPAAGLNEAETDTLAALIARIRKSLGCGVLVIEHDMRLIMGTCDRIHVLDMGSTIAVGEPAQIQTHEDVVAAYLGRSTDD
jgi:branched-chain amino acid transport system ATP-binding protein